MYLILPTILVCILLILTLPYFILQFTLFFILVTVPFLITRGLWAIAIIVDTDIVCSLAICSSEALVTIIYIVCTLHVYRDDTDTGSRY